MSGTFQKSNILKNIAFIHGLAFALIFTACAPKKARVTLHNQEAIKNGGTGLVKTTKKSGAVAFTTTNEGVHFKTLTEELSTEWQSKDIKERSLILSAKILGADVKITRDNNNNPKSYEIKVLFKNNKPNFKGLFKNINGDYLLEKSKTGRLTLSGACIESDCLKIKLFIEEKNRAGKLLGKSGFIYTGRKATFKTTLPYAAESIKNEQLSSMHSEYKEGLDIQIEDVEIANGRSVTRAFLKFNNKTECIYIENLETNKGAHRIDKNCSGKKLDYEIYLVGNTGGSSGTASYANNWILIRTAEGEELYGILERQKSNLRLVHASDESKEEVALEPAGEGVLGRYFIRADKNKAKDKARVSRITQGFESLRGWSSKANTTQWLLKSKSKKGVQNFFNNMAGNVEHLGQFFDEQNIPRTLMYLLFIESGMFTKHANQVVTAGVGGACEVGPWQFMYDTAKSTLFSDVFGWIKSKMKPHQQVYNHRLKKYVGREQCGIKGHKYSPRKDDPRNSLEASTKAAAKYLSHLIEGRTHDPLLGVISYNRGKGGVNKIGKKMSDRGLPFTSKALMQYNFPGTGYGKKFISMYFIGADPEKNGFKRPVSGVVAPDSIMYGVSR